jgi:hypothetical protein
MEISLTWGDIAVHSLIAIGAAFVVFLVTLLYRYTAPRVADYWARRSVSTAKTKIARLERMLAEYEGAFADSRLFMARTIRNAVIMLLLNALFAGALLMSTLYSIAASIRCEFYHNCPDHSYAPVWRATYDDRASLIYLFLTMIAEYLALMASAKFVREISPTKYRDHFGTRLANLRKRLPKE